MTNGTVKWFNDHKMKKFFMVLCVVIMFFGIAGCPSSDDPATTSSFKSVTSTSVASPGEPSTGGDINAGPEPATLLLIGSGLVGLGVLGRKRFKR